MQAQREPTLQVLLKSLVDRNLHRTVPGQGHGEAHPFKIEITRTTFTDKKVLTAYFASPVKPFSFKKG